jgi:hypothetical protein
MWLMLEMCSEMLYKSLCKVSVIFVQFLIEIWSAHQIPCIIASLHGMEQQLLPASWSV